MVGAHHHEDVRVEVAHDRLISVDGVGVSLVEATLSGAEVRMQQPHSPVGAVEAPRPPVGNVVGEQLGMKLLDDPDVARSLWRQLLNGKSMSR